jgi:hypothetical protein
MASTGIYYPNRARLDNISAWSSYFTQGNTVKKIINARVAGALLLMSLSLFSAHCSAQMYKCVNASGDSVFADKPCGPDAQPHVVKLPPPSAGFDSSTTLHDEMSKLNSMPDPLDGASVGPTSSAGPVNRQVVHGVVVERNRSTTAERNERIREKKVAEPRHTPN